MIWKGVAHLQKADVFFNQAQEHAEMIAAKYISSFPGVFATRGVISKIISSIPILKQNMDREVRWTVENDEVVFVTIVLFCNHHNVKMISFSLSLSLSKIDSNYRRPLHLLFCGCYNQLLFLRWHFLATSM